ncbi:MAG: PD-(D/E)XK nuclease family protein [Myxococcaceae bacterium]|nr:PD-(D/E)XK nuclease family protein [Myxococcaceae bacterium]
MRLVDSPSAAARQAEGLAFLQARAPSESLLIVAGSLDGGLELTRTVAAKRGALFGWQRRTLDALALELAAPALAEKGWAPASRLALEAVWARVVHALDAKDQLGRLAQVADRPGLPRALEQLVTEVRLQNVPVSKLDADLARAAKAFAAALADAGLADRAIWLDLAKDAPLAKAPLLLLDVALTTAREEALVHALAAASSPVLATVPTGDERSRVRLERALGVKVEHRPASGTSALARLQTHLFTTGDVPPGKLGDEVAMLSAPGELRECLEIARLIHRRAKAGTPFDRQAILLRAPAAYRAPLAEALRRAGIPAYFAKGVRAPDPSARAMLALLACAAENLSATRFAEYASLGEVPRAALDRAAPAAVPAGERFVAAAPAELDEVPALDEAVAPEEDESLPEAPVAQGRLRSPRRWERLLVDAAVIGGRDRWERRLDGLETSLRTLRAAPDVSEGRAASLDRTLDDLKVLRAFALPLLDELAALPSDAPWGEWLEALGRLASRALRRPERVLALLAELAPMGSVGPVGLSEVRRVLSQRLLEVTRRPDHHRFGQVFVGPIEAARGLSFEVVYLPGLAERVFPQKVREEPLMPDRARAKLGGALETEHDRVAFERLQLQLGVGAAERQLVFSYPRLDAFEGRPRVPSFYALEALRAAEGTLPAYEALARRTEQAVEARVGWPAPKDSATAVDDAERDLSLLDRLFRDRSGDRHTGEARYLTQVNPALARALRLRYARWTKKWNGADGLVSPSPQALAALAPHQLTARSFSATALQNYAACPYKFHLSAVVRLSPRQEAAAIEQLDPLQRGSMVHTILYRVLTTLRDQGRQPPKEADRAHGLALVDTVVDQVASELHDTYHPAIDRIWRDGVESIRADVRRWFNDTVDAAILHQVEPWRFELSFGLGTRAEQDPDSRPEPMLLPGGLQLRGSIDLVERSGEGNLTATDYKTGKQRAQTGTRVGGGKALQPILYSLALEKLFPGATVRGGALWYCTQAGEFTKVAIPLDAAAREAATQAIGVVGDALARGFFPAAPATNECTYCDFRAVCGPDEERRARKKSRQELEALQKLRSLQ